MRSVSLIGPEVGRLKTGSLGTYFLIALGFSEADEQTLTVSGDSDVLAKLVDIVTELKRSGIRYSLSDDARAGLNARLLYLEAFDKAHARGLEVRESADVSVSLPPSYARPLKPFQVRSVRHMIDLPYSANFSVPGSGKTAIVLAAWSSLKELGEELRLFVVCPRAAFDPWEEEFQKCFERRPQCARITGPPETRETLFQEQSEYELYLCSYQMLSNEIENVRRLIDRHHFMFVADESHRVKKGAEGIWYQAVSLASRNARRRVILSGTPAPNDISDLSPQLEILWPGLNIVRVPPNSTYEEAIESVRTSLSPFYVRIRKSDLGLPDRTISRVRVPMKPAQSRIYEALTQRILPHLVRSIEGREFLRELRRALVVRLLQAASNPALMGDFSVEFKMPPLAQLGVDLDQLITKYTDYECPSKIEAAVKLAMRIVDSGRKVIIWTYFIQNALTVSSELTRLGVRNVCVTGLLSTDEEDENRESLLRQFKTDEETAVLVATMPSIAESISLHHVCQDAIYLDRTFNCGMFMQSLDRIHRIGLPNDAQVRYTVLISNDTVDETIDARLEHKMDMMHQLLNDDIGVLNLETVDGDMDGDWDSSDIDAILTQISQRQDRDTQR